MEISWTGVSSTHGVILKRIIFNFDSILECIIFLFVMLKFMAYNWGEQGGPVLEFHKCAKQRISAEEYACFVSKKMLKEVRFPFVRGSGYSSSSLASVER